MTPEGRIKKSINDLIATYGDQIYKFMPVPGGFGASSLDYILCVQGIFVSIEAKKPGGKPTARQIFTIRQIKQSGGKTFVIDGDASLAMLMQFLDWVLAAPRTPQDVRKWPT